MTLWGESLRIVSASGVDTLTIRYRAGTATLAGTWDLWSTSSMSWVTSSSDPVVLSWVVEVASGSGSVTASEGMATGFTVPSLTSLGTVSASAGQLVIPSTLTVADLYGSSLRPFLRLSGSGIDVSQVKLRVWPTSGPVGGWSAPYQAPTTELTADVVRAGANTAAPGGGPWEVSGAGTAQDNLSAAQELLRDAVTASVVSGSTTLSILTGGVAAVADFGAVGVAEIVFPDNNSGAAHGGPGISWYVRDPVPIGNYEPPGEYGVDWLATPPDEVTGDPDVSYLVDGDPLGGDIVWAQKTVTVELSIPDSPTDEPASDAYHVGMTGLDDVGANGDPVPPLLVGTDVTIIHTDPGPQTESFDLIEPGDNARVVRVVIYHDGLLGELAALYTDDLGDGYHRRSTGSSSASVYNGIWDGFAVDQVTYLYTPPPFRYWGPAAALYPLRLMQRGDGLGMGSGRVYSTGTRQNSSRVFGSI